MEHLDIGITHIGSSNTSKVLLMKKTLKTEPFQISIGEFFFQTIFHLARVQEANVEVLFSLPVLKICFHLFHSRASKKFHHFFLIIFLQDLFGEVQKSH